MSYSDSETCLFFNDHLINDSNYISAGICGGRTTKTFVEYAESINKPFKNIYGFDSFVGLPKETDGVWCPPEWYPGQYSALEYFNLSTVEEAIQFCRNNVGNNRNNVHIIPGFFKDTLTKELGESLKDSAGFLDVDCDMHSSTVDFLEWIFTYDIMKIGCVVNFDDWIGGQYCHLIQDCSQAGENLALSQMTEKYNVVWADLTYNTFVYKGRK